MSRLSTDRRNAMAAVFVAAFISQNAIALPYVRARGARAIPDFFVGDILKTTPGRFAMVDLAYVVVAFHIWALAEARSIGIVRWWAVSFVMTFSVGIASAIPFYFLARERALSRSAG